MGFWRKFWKATSFWSQAEDSGWSSWGGWVSKVKKDREKNACDDREPGGRQHDWHDRIKKKFADKTCRDRDQDDCGSAANTKDGSHGMSDWKACKNHAPTILGNTEKIVQTTQDQTRKGTVIARIEAEDLDGDTLKFKLRGEDADHFDIDADTGVVTTRVDGLAPFASADGDSVFEIEVVAKDVHGAESDAATVDTIVFGSA